MTLEEFRRLTEHLPGDVKIAVTVDDGELIHPDDYTGVPGFFRWASRGEDETAAAMMLRTDREGKVSLIQLDLNIGDQ